MISTAVKQTWSRSRRGRTFCSSSFHREVIAGRQDCAGKVNANSSQAAASAGMI